MSIIITNGITEVVPDPFGPPTQQKHRSPGGTAYASTVTFAGGEVSVHVVQRRVTANLAVFDEEGTIEFRRAGTGFEFYRLLDDDLLPVAIEAAAQEIADITSTVVRIGEAS